MGRGGDGYTVPRPRDGAGSGSFSGAVWVFVVGSSLPSSVSRRRPSCRVSSSRSVTNRLRDSRSSETLRKHHEKHRVKPCHVVYTCRVVPIWQVIAFRRVVRGSHRLPSVRGGSSLARLPPRRKPSQPHQRICCMRGSRFPTIPAPTS